MNETVVFRNELGGYSTPYNKDTLARLYYELQKENEHLTAENERLRAENAKIDEYKCVIDDISEQCRELEAENASLRARLEKAVILPCKCEDTLYCVHWSKYNSKGGIITEEFVHKITFNDRNNTYTIHTICNGIWTESKFVAIDFGDILFADRSKAEARLAELKGGDKQ